MCSAVQNQDFTVVQDYITGLKAMLYLQAREDLADWDGQSPPLNYEMRSRIGKGLPKFGPFLEERLKKRSEYFKNSAKEVEETTTAPSTSSTRPKIVPPSGVPNIASQIGKALPLIGEYNQLNNKVNFFPTFFH